MAICLKFVLRNKYKCNVIEQWPIRLAYHSVKITEHKIMDALIDIRIRIDHGITR